MKTIHRYILVEFFESFFFGVIVFSGILLLDQVFQLINLLLTKGMPIIIVLKMFLLIMPNIFPLTFPMATLLGILLAYGRLSEDNEITSLRCAGLNYFNFTAPILLVAMLLSVFLLYFNMNVAPVNNREFRVIYRQILEKHPLIKFEEKSITNIGGYRIYAQKVEKETNVIKGINIYKFSIGDNGMPWRIMAASSTVSISPESVIFNLYNGYWQKIDSNNPNNLIHLNFSLYKFSVPLGGQIIMPSQTLKEMTSAELKKEIAQYRSKNMPTNFLEIEYWIRWILAISVLSFAIVGIPLGIILEKGAKAIGFGISLLILFSYYILFITTLNLAEKEYIQPGIILFLPNLVTIAIGTFFWKKMLEK